MNMPFDSCDRYMMTMWQVILKHRSLLTFFLIAIIFYLPFAVFADIQVFPNWSLFNFAAFIPGLVALILVSRENGMNGMAELLKRAIDYRRIKSKIWFPAIFLLIPFTVLVQYAFTSALRLPVSSLYFPGRWPFLFVIISIAAIREELGWMGYVFELMQKRLGALGASILLGTVWAIFHIPLFNSSGMSVYWITWQLIYVAATRILFVWVYNNSGKSIFAVVVLHTLFNSIWFLFPRNPEWVTLARPIFYDPTSLALITIIIAMIVGYLWGPRTLAQFRYTVNRKAEVGAKEL